jgi:hypothetical protein
VRRGIRIAVATAVSLGLLAAGGALIVTAPADAALVAPVGVPGAVGDTVRTRELDVRVTSVHLARRLHVADAFTQPGSATEGVWVAIDLTVSSRISPQTVGWSTLQIGGTRFSVDDGITGTMADTRIGPGVPEHGTILFEVSRAALASPGARDAVLTLRYSGTDVIDTVPVVHLDLSRLPVEPTATVLAVAVVPHGTGAAK